MKNKFFIYFLAVLLISTVVLGITGCQSGSTPVTTPPAQTTKANTGTPSSSPGVSPLSAQATTRSITDMAGRILTVPVSINRVLGTSPHEPLLVYMIAPDKLVGVPSAFKGNYVPAKYKSLPAVGSWNASQVANYETFISMQPDIVLKGQVETDAGNPTDIMQAKFGNIPVVMTMLGGSLTDLENSARFVGSLLNARDNAESLITYYQQAMTYVKNVSAQIPAQDKVRVYYAEGSDGLSTDPTGSRHTELIDLCGGTNIGEVPLNPKSGQAQASLEQIFKWNPDIIIIGRGSQATLYKQIMSDPRWAQLRAVQNGKVFIRPEDPYAWFDGPPGVNQIIGLYWTVSKLYPDKTTGLDLNSKIKEFYSKFYHYDLTDQEVAKLLANPS